MTLRVGRLFGEKLTTAVARALDLTSPIYEIELDSARAEAFSSSNSTDFMWNYLRSEAFRKFSESQDDLEDVTISRFIEDEAHCAMTNERLVDVWSRPNLDTGSWIKARRFISRILGPFPWERFPLECDFGPGASVGLKRKLSQKHIKWDLSSHITEAALPYQDRKSVV